MDIKEILIENTGRNMMDSGDIYGRNFERNQEKGILTGYQPVDFYIDEQNKEVEINPTIPVYDFLSYNLEYDDELDDWFNHIIKKEGLNAYSIIDQKEALQQIPDVEELSECYNTYNGECVLSQTLQFYHFEYWGEDFVLLQVHNGCDVRGGYTYPKIFQTTDFDMFYLGLTDCQIDCECSSYHYEDVHSIYLDMEDGELWVGDPISQKEMYTRVYEDDEGILRCKKCNGKIEARFQEY